MTTLSYLGILPVGIFSGQGELLEAPEGNADGEGTDPYRPAAVLHQQAGPVHPAAQAALAAVYEVDAVVLDVIGDEVTAEDALEEGVAPGEYFHHVPGGKGDVEEEAELAGEPLLLGHLQLISRVQRNNFNQSREMWKQNPPICCSAQSSRQNYKNVLAFLKKLGRKILLVAKMS